MSVDPTELLQRWLTAELPPEATAWLREQAAAVAGGDEAVIDRAVSLVARRLGKSAQAPMALAAADVAAASSARPGWDPRRWSAIDAARILLLLHAPQEDADAVQARLMRLLRSADLGEQISLLRGLALYAHPERHLARATEGVRSNIQDVFEAVAHRSPYPAEHFPDQAWNQMVLKALFVGSRLAPIQGLEARANPELTRMLCDYAHERWAAGRRVSPELWRCVGSCPIPGVKDDLERALRSDDDLERQGAALACGESPDAGIHALLDQHPRLAARAVETGWDELAAVVPG